MLKNLFNLFLAAIAFIWTIVAIGGVAKHSLE